MDVVKLVSITEQTVCLNSLGKTFQPGDIFTISLQQAMSDSEIQECVALKLLRLEKVDNIVKQKVEEPLAPQSEITQPDLPLFSQPPETIEEGKKMSDATVRPEEERSASIFAMPDGRIVKEHTFKQADMDIPDFVPEDAIAKVGEEPPEDDTIRWIGDIPPDPETLSGEPAMLTFENGTVKEQ